MRGWAKDTMCLLYALPSSDSEPNVEGGVAATQGKLASTEKLSFSLVVKTVPNQPRYFGAFATPYHHPRRIFRERENSPLPSLPPVGSEIVRTLFPLQPPEKSKIKPPRSTLQEISLFICFKRES